MMLVGAICYRRSWMIRERATGEVGIRRESSAYRSGWEDGRFGQVQTFVTNNNLAAWPEFLDRLSYYRGHRDGRRVREMLVSKGRPAGP
jgi:hypothetical protein